MRTTPPLKFNSYNGTTSLNRGHKVVLDFTNSKDGRATVEVKLAADVKPAATKNP